MEFGLRPIGLRPTVQYVEHSTQKFVPNDLAGNCVGGSWATQVGGPKRGGGQGPGAKHPMGTVQRAVGSGSRSPPKLERGPGG